MQKLTPPLRFQYIEENLYSGSYPVLINYRFLNRLKLKTIISLVPEKIINDMSEYIKKYEIKSYHFKASQWKETISLSDEQVNQIIEILIDNRNSPIYIHCLDGGNVTSQVIMSLRKLQNYDLKSIFDEAKKYTEKISDDEKNFIKNFKGTIKVNVNNKT
jgi:tyrosine-protein phosphatase OCA6